jgi:hypothetical protein
MSKASLADRFSILIVAYQEEIKQHQPTNQPTNQSRAFLSTNQANRDFAITQVKQKSRFLLYLVHKHRDRRRLGYHPAPSFDDLWIRQSSS